MCSCFRSIKSRWSQASVRVNSSSIFIFLNFGMNSWITTSGGVARLAKETGLDSGGIDILDE